MQNLAAAIIAVLCVYIAWKVVRKQRGKWGEALGLLGLSLGFLFLAKSTHADFPGFLKLFERVIDAIPSFFQHYWFFIMVFAFCAFEVIKIKKVIFCLAWFALAIISFFVLVLGYTTDRALLIPLVFFIIADLNIVREFSTVVHIPAKAYIGAMIVLTVVPIPLYGEELTF